MVSVLLGFEVFNESPLKYRNLEVLVDREYGDLHLPTLLNRSDDIVLNKKVDLDYLDDRGNLVGRLGTKHYEYYHRPLINCS